MTQTPFSNHIPERSEWYMANQLINILLKTGKISESQIADITFKKQNNPKESTEEILMRMKIIEENEIPSMLEEYYKVPYINLNGIKINEKLLKIFPENIAKKYTAIPIELKENEITIAISSPNDINTLDSIQYIIGYAIKPLVALESGISKAIEKFYSLKKMTQKNNC